MPLKSPLQKQSVSVVDVPPDRADETCDGHDREQDNGDALTDDVPPCLDILLRSGIVVIMDAAVVDVRGAAGNIKVFPTQLSIFCDDRFREDLLIHQRNERRTSQPVAVKESHVPVAEFQSQGSGVQGSC